MLSVPSVGLLWWAESQLPCRSAEVVTDTDVMFAFSVGISIDRKI